MPQPITIPPAPSTKEEAIAGFTVIGAALKAYMEATEANPDWVMGAIRTVFGAHRDLNRAGYLLEEAFGVPDNTFSAGGGGPKP